MELALYIILGIVIVLICWKPFMTFRRTAPEAMDITMKHGIKILKVNILEDEQDLQKRVKSVQEARANNEWIDVDAVWDDLHPAK